MAAINGVRFSYNRERNLNLNKKSFNYKLSFSEQVFDNMFCSNYLYSSNCHLRYVKDEGSIRKSLPVEIDIFDLKEKPKSITNRGLKAARFIARIAIAFFSQYTIAPLGVIVHGSHCLVCLSSHVVIKLKGEDTTESWSKIEKRGIACLKDGAVFLTGIASVVFTPLIVAKVAALWNAFGILGAVIFVRAYLGYSGMLLALNWVPLCAGGVLPLHITNKDERLCFYKSLMLKNNFGIVNNEGKILTSTIEDDFEYFPAINKGHFGDIYCQQSQKFLYAIEDLIEALTEESVAMCKFDSIFIKGDQELSPHLRNKYKFNAKVFVTFLKKNKDRLAFENQEKSIDQFIKEFESLQKNIDKMHGLLNAYYTESVSGKTYLGFPYDDSSCRSYFHKMENVEEPLANSQEDWMRALSDAKASEKRTLEALPEDIRAKFSFFRKRLNQRNLSPQGFFGLGENFTKAAARKVHLRLSIDFHPDKLQQSKLDDVFIAEGRRYFELGGIAYKELLKAL